MTTQPPGSREVADHGFLARTDRPLVVYVIHHHDISGAELLQAPVIARDADALVACPPGSRTAAFAERVGAATVPLPFRVLRHSGGTLETVRSAVRGVVGARDLRRVLRAHPERRIVYSVSLRPALLAALAGVGLRRTHVWTLPDLMPPAPIRQAGRVLARLTRARVTALSHAIARDFAGRSRRRRDRVRVIHPGPDLARFAPAPPEPERFRRVAIVGQVAPNKRVDLALDVVERVAAEEDEFLLEVIGRAQFRDEDFAFERALHARAEASDVLRRHVRFAGYTSDVAGRMRESGVLLHCRVDEPFGMVLVEAMASGLCVIAPRSAGPAEIVDDGVTGLLYRPGDAGEAAAHLLRLLRDPAEAARMARAGRRRAEERFSADLQVAAVEAFLAEAAGSSRAPVT